MMSNDGLIIENMDLSHIHFKLYFINIFLAFIKKKFCELFKKIDVTNLRLLLSIGKSPVFSRSTGLVLGTTVYIF